MDVDKEKIGAWPNIACAPGEAVKPPNREAEARRLYDTDYQFDWNSQHTILADLANDTHFTRDEIEERLIAARRDFAVSVLLEGGAV